MATTSKNAMQTQKLIILQAKRECIYERLHHIYVLSKDAQLDKKGKEDFLSSIATLDLLRDEFQANLDSYFSLNLEIDPMAKPDYKPLISFDDLFCRIKRVISLLNPSTEQTIINKAEGMDKAKPRLPPIELMSFNGDIRSWPLFYQQFKHIVHDNPRLTDSERVHYLVGKLSDKVKSVCAGLPATAENYLIIWEALVRKYDDTRSLATSYLNQLFEFKPLTSVSAIGLDSFLETFAASVRALQQLKIDNLLDFIFLHLSLKKLDPETTKLFEMFMRSEKIPTYDSLIKFITEQSRIVGRTSSEINKFNNNNINKPNRNMPSPKQQATKSFVNTHNIKPCVACNQHGHEHLYKCPRFMKLTPFERYELVKKHAICNNCLSKNHKFAMCQSQGKCVHCSSRHHSLLHFNKSASSLALQENNDNNDSISPGTSKQAAPTRPGTVSICNVSCSEKEGRVTTLLGTARIIVYDHFGRKHSVRCLIDPGSQSEYISARCCELLSLPISNQSRYSEVYGIGGTSQKLLGMVSLTFTARFEDGPKFDIKPLVVPRITGNLPDSYVDTAFLKNVKNLPLADDQFHVPGEVDMLLGVNVYTEIMLVNQIKGKNNSPSLLETSLGYILLGDARTLSSATGTQSFCALTHGPLDNILEKFWKLEELPEKTFLSPEEQNCEDIYASTTTRSSDGRYSVNLLFKDDPDKLGESFPAARRRFLSLENKFEKSPALRDRYNNVIREYLEKGFLSLVPPEASKGHGFFIPHHPVIRNDKDTTKLRIVLDASAHSDTGLSLNDVLHTGVNLQADIFKILLDVRIFPVAFIADVRQMYLCIGVHEPHRRFQRIIYRFTSEAPLETYEFNRVAFGLRSSPFLALRTLRQLSKDERDRFPLAAEVVERDMYMDDLACSVYDVSKAAKVADQLINLFKAGGFDLVKWTSNSPAFLEHIPVSHRKFENISFDDDDRLKILGLQWQPVNDIFVFSISLPQQKCTKRSILSATARLYDVLGLVGPVILYAKLIIKELWLLKLDWDATPPQHIVSQWQQYVEELPLLSKIEFPRHLGIEKSSEVSLLAFADASEKAYGCVIYFHVVNDNAAPFVSLVCAKSRVAPVKMVTLARLELCGTVLLAKLVRIVYDCLSQRHPIKNIYAFSDSTVALSWIHSSPHRFNTFVANRIAQCQSNLAPEHFYHVLGTENPADCLSRGLPPSRLVEHPLWFRGPPWASLPRNEWPIIGFVPSMVEVPEEKTVSHVSTDVIEHPLIRLSLRFSSWIKFLRSVVYFLRFIKRLPRNCFITASDLNTAELMAIRAVQRTVFLNDIMNIKKGISCSPALRRLTPFLKDGVLRVGGRLSNSSLDYAQKHPILLPRNGHVIDLIIDHSHREHCHAGPQLLLSILRQTFWILSARRIVRSRVNKCNQCFKLRPQPTFPLMADLPTCRVEPCKAFLHAGIDYAGPLHISQSKAYLCLFVCLVTRAVHIELASDLSSATFLEAFKRFLSRRGPCNFLYSDNGTNFVGAKAYLDELHTFVKSEGYFKTFAAELSKNRIEWKMNPPNAPHFGGIWEANIKSLKTHLFRVIGKQILTYEEMLTVLNQIEALLNSRPLYLLSSDPSEPAALTPSHFLATAPLEYLPAADLSQETLTSRVSLFDSLVQSFWKRFKQEYLHNLQTREKWNTPANPVETGTVVIIITDNAPPLRWPLGIITRLYPGKDGIARVAEVRTASGVYKRPVVRLCPLPTQ